MRCFHLDSSREIRFIACGVVSLVHRQYAYRCYAVLSIVQQHCPLCVSEGMRPEWMAANVSDHCCHLPAGHIPPDDCIFCLQQWVVWSHVCYEVFVPAVGLVIGGHITGVLWQPCCGYARTQLMHAHFHFKSFLWASARLSMTILTFNLEYALNQSQKSASDFSSRDDQIGLFQSQLHFPA